MHSDASSIDRSRLRLGSTVSSACSSATPASNASSPRKPAAILSASRRLSPSPGKALTRKSRLAIGCPTSSDACHAASIERSCSSRSAMAFAYSCSSSHSGISSTHARTSSPRSCRRASRPTDSAMTRIASCGSMKQRGMCVTRLFAPGSAQDRRGRVGRHRGVPDATGCSTQASGGSTTSVPVRKRTRSRPRSSLPIRCARVQGGAKMTTARFPEVPTQAGHYESFFLRAVDPARPRGAWIRYTVHKRPGEQPVGSLWCTVFDAEHDGPAAVKETRPEPRVPDGGWIAIGDATFGETAAHGQASGQDRRAAWELQIAGAAPPLHHLPSEWMYRAPLPRTKVESPVPDAAFGGWVEVGGRHVEVQGWRGMVGHNWGREHAERWIWLHATAFADAPGAWLDLALGRIKVAGRRTPWIANGALALDGRRVRLGGLGHLRSIRVRETPTEAEIALAGDGGVNVHAAVRSPQTVGWVYADLSGGARHVAHGSLAALTLRVERRGQPPLELATGHGAAYELGGREGLAGVAVEPFGDP